MFCKDKDKEQTYDFDYRITEKKRANGATYYIGEGVLAGELCLLVECAYEKRRYDSERDRIMYSGSMSAIPKYKPRYVLKPALGALYEYGHSPSDVRAEMSDPVEMKEIICAVIKDSKVRATNLAHKKVISVGVCKCD